jgi:glycerate 2-kinase
MTSGPRALLRAMFDAAVASALPEKSVPLHLPPPPKGRTVVIGAGKASAAMARALEDHWAGPLTGLVVTRYGHAVTCQRLEIVEAAHPVPDAKGRDAVARILQMVQGLTEDDLVIALISGGGSSLLSLPAPGLTLEDKQAVNRALRVQSLHQTRSLVRRRRGSVRRSAWPTMTVTASSRLWVTRSSPARR